MIFKDITFKTDCVGQAEGFLLNGDHNMASGVGVIGSRDINLRSLDLTLIAVTKKCVFRC
jgi:hypothetical protein